MLLLLLTTLSSAPLVATPPRPPDTVRPVVAVIVAEVTDATLRAELVVRVFCFALSPAEIVVIISTPPRYRGPKTNALLLQITLPDTSRDGALTGHENTALPLESPSLSTFPESARLNVPVAGFTREHVSWFTVTEDEEDSVACFPAS